MLMVKVRVRFRVGAQSLYAVTMFRLAASVVEKLPCRSNEALSME